MLSIFFRSVSHACTHTPPPPHHIGHSLSLTCMHNDWCHLCVCIYRGIDIDMWCESHPSSPIRIVCPCTNAMWPNDVCHRYLKFKSVWPCSMCIHYNMLVSKPHRAYLSYIHACMGIKHHDLLFKYLNSILHWLWPHLLFYTHTVVFSL